MCAHGLPTLLAVCIAIKHVCRRCLRANREPVTLPSLTSLLGQRCFTSSSRLYTLPARHFIPSSSLFLSNPSYFSLMVAPVFVSLSLSTLLLFPSCVPFASSRPFLVLSLHSFAENTRLKVTRAGRNGAPIDRSETCWNLVCDRDDNCKCTRRGERSLYSHFA